MSDSTSDSKAKELDTHNSERAVLALKRTAELFADLALGNVNQDEWDKLNAETKDIAGQPQ